VVGLRLPVAIGVYFFGAKARLRRYLFSETEFSGDRFAYHGLGKELLLGFLRAFAVFLLPVIALGVIADWPGVDVNVKAVAQFLGPPTFFPPLPGAMARAPPHPLTPPSCPGIRFSFP